MCPLLSFNENSSFTSSTCPNPPASCRFGILGAPAGAVEPRLTALVTDNHLSSCWHLRQHLYFVSVFLSNSFHPLDSTPWVPGASMLVPSTSPLSSLRWCLLGLWGALLPPIPQLSCCIPRAAPTLRAPNPAGGVKPALLLRPRLAALCSLLKIQITGVVVFV